jgi:3-keto-5-aminohexanoate cleavage enzyme
MKGAIIKAYENEKGLSSPSPRPELPGQGPEPQPAQSSPRDNPVRVWDCYNAGASIVHVHARDKNGKSCNDGEIFAEINSGIRAKVRHPRHHHPESLRPRHRDKRPDGRWPRRSRHEGPQLLARDVLLDCSLIDHKHLGDLEFIYMWTASGSSRPPGIKDMGIKAEIEVF